MNTSPYTKIKVIHEEGAPLTEEHTDQLEKYGKYTTYIIPHGTLRVDMKDAIVDELSSGEYPLLIFAGTWTESAKSNRTLILKDLYSRCGFQYPLIDDDNNVVLYK